MRWYNPKWLENMLCGVAGDDDGVGYSPKISSEQVREHSEQALTPLTRPFIVVWQVMTLEGVFHLMVRNGAGGKEFRVMGWH